MILPVHDGREFLARLLPKLIEDDSVSRLILIDDASRDRAVVRLIDEAAANHPKLELVRNETSLGFVKSANEGLRRITADCVLLNSDVDVPAGWIGRLLEPIRRDAAVASTTPFTNSGTILSFPEWLIDNDVYGDLPVERIDAAFRKLAPGGRLPEMPTGVGFCMGMSRRAVSEVGLFDEESYGRGYGEENDWCQRAIQKGYRHLPVVNLYVHHDHGGSFSAEEKGRLTGDHLEITSRKHPSYLRAVRRFTAANPLRRYREVANLLVLAGECSKGVCLVLDHEEGGGANLFRERVVAEIDEGGELALVAGWRGDLRAWRLEVHHPRWSGSMEFADCVEFFLLARALPLRRILVNSLVFDPDPPAVLRELAALAADVPDAKMEFFLHDYHALCPSHTLLNAEGGFCDLPGSEVCERCLERNPRVAGGVRDIEQWRDHWREFFTRVSVVRAFSASSAALFERVFPEHGARVEVKPHERYYDAEPMEPGAADLKGKPVVAVVGKIGFSKGAAVVRDLSRVGSCDLVVLGGMARRFSFGRRIVVHGRYERRELRELMERYKVTMCLLPSIWPETYHFVADEIMRLGMPLICFDIGAHAERVAAFRLGKVVPLEFAEDPGKLAAAITRFQEELAEATPGPSSHSERGTGVPETGERR